MRKVVIHNRRILLDGFLKVEEASLQFEKFDGSLSRSITRLSLERGDLVAAILIDRPQNEIIMITQFRYPTYQHGPGWMTEIVAGMVNPEESPESAIRREILEETGYQVSALEKVSTFYVSPGGSSERIFLFCADIQGVPVEGGGGNAAEDEDVCLVRFDVAALPQLLREGYFLDAKTIIALQWLNSKGGRQ